ncbi:cation-translocating P-type ATPase [Lactobacillus sp. YT155]|uniref:heavy metal translocating P-type ATPase n=1 Tax=Lactobacillus sp. YT155 TaxID=3060955 RepID=UPI0026603141|nr:cation-translocating P-type ATPase [Lactobacillus sp. YT155]MDO1604798.1 cation-translocating P-type ATPase [Lactobacillus sp. YT155]
MIKYINKHNNLVAMITGVLIILAFVSLKLLNINSGKYLFLIGGIIGGIPIFVKAIEAIKIKVISIDLLVSIAIIGGLLIGEFEESAVVAFLFLFGNFLEQKTLKKTRNSIRQLVELVPKKANKKLDSGEIQEIPIDDLEIDDVVVINTGGQIPADGKVVAGRANINQSAITGESKLISVNHSMDVFAGSIVDNGSIEVSVTRIGDETTLGKIIELVEEAQDTKSPAEKFIDRFAKFYTPIVLLISLLVFAITQNIKLAITILVLGCPGALVIGAPVSIVAGIGNGANKGILLQGGNVINQMAKVKTFIFDKTNTLTNGEMRVSIVKQYQTILDEDKLLISSMEQKSDHPLAKAMIQYFGKSNDAIEVATVKGQGLVHKNVLLGNEKLLLKNNITLTTSQYMDLYDIQNTGASTILYAKEGVIVAIIGISDTLKPTAKSSLNELRKLGAKNLVILSGDNKIAVDYVAKQLLVDKSIGELLPEQKVTYVKDLQKDSKVAFVGDGINDSPSIATADIGIAMGNGTDVAIETSDIVLANSSLENLVYAYVLSKKTFANVKENIFIAIGTVALLLLGLALGVINMASGMLFHELSILIVILNGMRLIKYSYKN